MTTREQLEADLEVFQIFLQVIKKRASEYENNKMSVPADLIKKQEYATRRLLDIYTDLEHDDYILLIISRHLNIPVTDIKAKSRKREFVDARRLYCHFAKMLKGGTLEEIGSAVNIDHSQVIHMFHTHETLIQSDRGYREKFIKIRAVLKAYSNGIDISRKYQPEKQSA